MNPTDQMPLITLNSGLTVANFSSGHTFTFDTGEVLAACSPKRARALSLVEREDEKTLGSERRLNVAYTTVRQWFVLSTEQELALDDAHLTAADVILVPFPQLLVMADYAINTRWPLARACVAAVKGRPTPGQPFVVSSTRFRGI